MPKALLAIAAGFALLTGCYRVTVVSGTTPSPTVVDNPWQHSFLYGLVPPSEINVKEQCPNGVYKVETETSFLNGLAAALTSSLYAPIHAKVTCSARR